MANPVIEINHLTKSYGKARGIIDVSFNVEEQEIFGFIGPNGAGKSTTIRTLLSLIYPTQGSAKIFGLDIIKDRTAILQNVGYLPSEVFYYNNMRVIDLLRYSASFYHKDCNARINEISELLELDLKRKIDELSYGNRKKVGIVQGLLHEPKLIILDEPTGGLDPLMQARFFDLIKQERDHGATVLFSSHILSEVQNLCDRVAIIKEGRVIKIERISTLRENTYKRIALETEAPLPDNYFNLEGITAAEINGHRANFLYNGNINAIMQRLCALQLKNISINEPDLEELFRHYYQ